jgi:hypothetical protein
MAMTGCLCSMCPGQKQKAIYYDCGDYLPCICSKYPNFRHCYKKQERNEEKDKITND